jgi:NosR/NirI family nitrous oxide reductase transcriptional regulator
MISQKRLDLMRAFIYYLAVIVLLALIVFLAVRSIAYADITVERRSDGTLLIQTLGYHDVIRVTAREDASGGYRDLRLIESSESPLYASDYDIEAYLSRLEGIEPDKMDRVDGITGATFTTEAIRAALMQTTPLIRWVEMLLYAVLWILTLLFAILKKRPVLFVISCLWFVLVGLVYNSPVGVYSVFTLTRTFHLLVLLALLSVLLYRNTYCSHICPFGFLQRLTRMIPVRRRYPMPSTLRTGKYVVLSMAAISFLMGNLLYLEPYSYLFSRKLNLSIYLFPVLMLAVSAFIPHFWCRGFCPVGALMQIGGAIRRWAVSGKLPRLSLLQNERSTAKRSTAKRSDAKSSAAVGLAILTFAAILLSNVLFYVQ